MFLLALLPFFVTLELQSSGGDHDTKRIQSRLAT